MYQKFANENNKIKKNGELKIGEEEERKWPNKPPIY